MFFIQSIILEKIYTFFPLQVLKFLLAGICIIWIVIDTGSGGFAKIPLILLCLIGITDIFFRFKIEHIGPGYTISSVDQHHPILACSREAARILLNASTISEVRTKLFICPQVQFLFQRLGISSSEVSAEDISVEEVLAQALHIVGGLQGQYITTMDVVTAYLFLTEPKTKYLFTAHIKTEDLLMVLEWGRRKYHNEEFPPHPKIQYNGGGIGESLITGWTPETRKYTLNLTAEAVNNTITVIGREQSFDLLTQTLLKNDNNNALLVGNTGTGKENLVKALAQKSFSGHLSHGLNNKVIYELLLGQLTAGAGDQSVLESRIQSVIEEISHAGNVILYISDFENVVGASSFNMNLTGALSPYIQTGQLPIIGTVTEGSYKEFLQNNPFTQAFEVITIPDPSLDVALEMVLFGISDLEKKNPVIITYKAIQSAVTLSSRFEEGVSLPGSALNLLDFTAQKVCTGPKQFFAKTKRKLVEELDVVQTVEGKIHVSIAEPNASEKQLLLHLEEKLHERVVDQVDAITALSENLRRLRSGLASPTKPISFLFLGPTGVGKTETAKALADLYYGGESNIVRLDMSEYGDPASIQRLLGAKPGEGNERGELTDKIHDHPNSLLLLDEFEKSNPKILDLFLQILEDGRITDNKGRTVSFINTLIIATSNAGSEFIRESVQKGVVVNKQFQKSLMDYLQQERIFKPELLNRFDNVITFKPLGPQESRQIIQLLLQKVQKNLAEKDITVVFNDSVMEKIMNEGMNEEFGARPLRRYIQDSIEDRIAQAMLKDEVKRGDSIIISVDPASNTVGIKSV